jgi:nucleotide-binding universal stress UspA family protein
MDTLIDSAIGEGMAEIRGSRPIDAGIAMRTILVATDFSASSVAAVAWGRQLARQKGAELVLVHAVSPPTEGVPGFLRWPQQHYDEIRTGARAHLRREAVRVRGDGVRVRTALGVGPAVAVINGAAERHGADVIVAGTRGRTEWKRLLLGSTVAGVIRTARCPVLTIHPDAGSPRPIRTVLVATDFSEIANTAAAAASRIVGGPAAGGAMTLLHAYHVEYEAAYLPAAILADALNAADATVKRKLGELTAALREAGMAIGSIACEGYPPDAIVDHARSIRADAIAMGTHGLSGLDRLLIGSTAERVIASAPCPVLTVRG